MKCMAQDQPQRDVNRETHEGDAKNEGKVVKGENCSRKLSLEKDAALSTFLTCYCGRGTHSGQ